MENSSGGDSWRQRQTGVQEEGVQAEVQEHKEAEVVQKSCTGSILGRVPGEQKEKSLAKSSVSKEALLELVKKVGCSDMAQLGRVVE